MRILISGGRAPYALELARCLGRQGHEIHILEFFQNCLASSSRFVKATHVIPGPAVNQVAFRKRLLQLLEENKFDLLIPTCEETIYLSKHKSEVERHTKLFACAFDEALELHDKKAFNRLLVSKGLPAPLTYERSQVDDEVEYIVKKRFSRFGSHVRRLKGKDIRKERLGSGDIVQEKMLGKEYSLYCIVVEGRVMARALYPKQFSIGAGASCYFEHEELSVASKWAQDFFQGSGLCGQYSFDLFVNENAVYAIECNPRTTSGVHLLRDELELGLFLGEGECALPSGRRDFMLAIPMIFFGLRLGNFFDWLVKLSRGTDVVFDRNDIKPFFAQFSGLLRFARIAWRKKIPLVDATTLDIEFNGELR